MIKQEYKKIVEIFEQHEKSFKERKEKMNTIPFSKTNWSNSYIDFTTYESIINQLKPPKVFEKEKMASIKNHYVNDKLIYSFNKENENWGSVFVDYDNDNTKWLLFSENYDDEMVLQQLKIAYYQNNRIIKKIFYLSDKDAEEETLMVDLFNYNKDDKLDSIIRNGFYEMKATVLPERKISFEYGNSKVKIYSTQEIAGDVKKQLIYEGKEC
ncbi:hypothetical protein [uncultured Lacinutrix sp.]|uniref:hypothetical protein n=1 Tax=uncultured Lacinutrix sp. TaxID=574032 RepID=UPI002635AD49|nr:hypothetical protein [uncultured Lacinutrix sp.]